MLKENELLRSLMSQPPSVYFDAYRTEVEYLSMDVLLFIWVENIVNFQDYDIYRG